MTTHDQLDAADKLAKGVESFLSSLPYMAPEMVGFQAKVKLDQPFQAYVAAWVDAAETKGKK